MINQAIKKLVSYAINCGLIEEGDRIYSTNRILELLCLDEYEESAEKIKEVDLESTLCEILDYAAEKGIIKNDTTSRDLFDTKLMSVFVPAPSFVSKKFYSLYEKNPVEATDFYYKFSCDTDYIRRYRIKRDLKWKSESEYGEMDITVNLSKPEKTPEEIAIAKTAKQSGYPKCLLCVENEGYAGRINHPARQNHRIMPITIDNSQWGFQYSPYVYYNEHCIVFNKIHTPMKIDKSAFKKLFDFVKLFPHYFIGSNADLPIVGGSILSHEHFQGGHYEFAMAKAPIEKEFSVKGFEDVSCGIVKWPMSVIRISGESTDRLCDLADKILSSWRGYSDEECFIFSETEGEKHNTITPIARKRGDLFEMDLVLRNNITTKEHPFGVYHPHAELHNIKKENIGLIEVMGLAVLPSRLKKEMALLEKAILEGENISENKEIEKHAQWFDSFKDNYCFTKENTMDILKKEIGVVFAKVLEHAGVYKRDEKGRQGFERFISQL
ncbi:MAG: UDP-glucose--hexose-1-phosphate uridylyltransferase [Clostridia bacterium]|nr:UDP-glucose--hexose-1-phosphate uridylyltransferase [Clostridia bacterium]